MVWEGWNAILVASAWFVHAGHASESQLTFPNGPGVSSYSAAFLSNESIAVPPRPPFESVWARVIRDINTECKTCPYPGCSNKDWYGSSQQFAAQCWTAGAIIGNTNVWLRSEQGCYVTKYDTINYWRDYITDLKPCGSIPEQANRQYGTMTSSASCRICPNNRCDVVGNYNYNGKVTLSCSAQTISDQCLNYCAKSQSTSSQPVLNNQSPAQWYRTVNNCYIPASSARGDTQRFETCGPVPFLKGSFRNAALRNTVSSSTPAFTDYPARQPDLGPVPTPSPSPEVPESQTSEFSWFTPENPTSSFSYEFPSSPIPSQASPSYVPKSLDPILGPSNYPKLTTSHLTVPSVPTPRPVLPKTGFPGSFSMSLPSRPRPLTSTATQPASSRQTSATWVKAASPTANNSPFRLNLPPRPIP